jgi:hypothetical protein
VEERSPTQGRPAIFRDLLNWEAVWKLKNDMEDRRTGEAKSKESAWIL